MGKGAHVTGTLHIVLSPQGIHPDAFPANITGQHGEVGDTHDPCRALTMLGNAQSVVDRCIPGRGKQSRCPGDAFGGNTRYRCHRLGRITLLRDESSPLLEGGLFTALGNEFLRLQTFFHDYVGHGI